MPTPQEWNAARVEAMLSLGFEAAAGMEEDGPLPEDVQAQIRAISEMRPPDGDEGDDEADEPTVDEDMP